MEDRALQQLAIDTIRTLSIDMVNQANSGHPGMPMGAAPMAYVLWKEFLKQNPTNPAWFDRDRFVLSAGHGSALLYSLLHLFGYDLTMEDLKNFRQWGSRTPGHPEFGHTPGVEATTGPLGQGVSMAVGMAMSERFLAATYNRDGFDVINHYTYSICGDGDLMEGVSAEAASLAGHLKLGRLVVLYDSNDISLDGETNLAFSEDVSKRFESYGWQVLRVEDGNNVEEIEAAIEKAKADPEHPALIEIKTTIGFGSPNRAGTSSAHGAPLGEEEAKLTKEQYGWKHEPFHVPDPVRDLFAAAKFKGQQEEADWKSLFAQYRDKYPELADELQAAMEGRLPENWTSALPLFKPEDGKMATRDASGKILNAIAKQIPYFLGGSADLASSNKTNLKDLGVFSAQDYKGRNIWFGVREHAMGAILNGMKLHGGVIPFAATFFVFSDYLRPAMRLSALMKLPVTYVLTHDSIAVGEDGPTHEPIEHLASLRVIPDMTVIRPADANETVAAYYYAVAESKGPVSIVLSRQGLPVLDVEKEQIIQNVARGGYVLADPQGQDPHVILIATGSEVSLAMQAKNKLAEQDVAARVVSMPSWELFEQQPQSYKDAVLPSRVTARVAIEMGRPFGWERYVGEQGAVIAIDRFGASAPGDKIMHEYGFTVDHVLEVVHKVRNA